MKRRRVMSLVLSIVLLLVAAVPYGSGKANAAQTGVGSGIVKISAGTYHSLALKGDGTVASWGYNGSLGQLNVPTGLTGVESISAGWYHSLALKEDGTVVAWGMDTHGQMNVPTGLSGVAAISAGWYHSLALKTDGTVVAWGNNFYGESDVPAGLTGVVAIAAGWSNSLALKSDGTVAAWGRNFSGQSNVPAGLTGGVAIAAGWNHSLALKADGTVVAWGDNSDGQTTVPAGLTGVVSIAAGAHHSLALKADGTVVAWGNASGDDNYGQTDVPAGLSGVMAIAAGAEHSLALKADGTVVTWGGNSVGQTDVPAGLAKPVKGGAVAAGSIHSLALKSDGTVEAWGGSAGDVWGDGDPDLGELTVPAGLTGVTAIAAGAYHSLALTANGTVVAWGDNRDGQADVPGLSGAKAVSGGTQHSLALTANGTVLAWGSDYYDQTDVPSGLSGVVAIAAGGFHSLALKADGTVEAWGSNTHGQTDVPAGLSGVVAIAAGSTHSLALKADGTVVAWGGDFHGQSYVPAGLTGVVAISAGGLHSLALKADGTVVAWGDNFNHQSAVPAELTGVVAISAGGTLSLALKSDGTVVAWGAGPGDSDYYGQTNVPGNDRLSGLTVQEGDIDPVFSSLTTEYTLDGPSVLSVHITATLADPTYAELYVDNKPLASGSTATVNVSGATMVIPVRVEPYLKPPRTYTITVHGDGAPPDVQFAANGHATPSQTAESTVTVTDAESGVDAASLQYAWTQSTAVPADGWTTFASGDTLRQTSGDGNWYLHIRARDLAGNVADVVSNAFVLDNTAPELTLIGSNPMNIPQGGTYTEPGAVAADAIDGAIPASSITISGAVDTARLGNYPVQYAVEDRAGNTATVTRAVYVYDGDAPAIYLNGASPMTVEANGPFVDPGATAQDVQDGDLSALIIVTGTVDSTTLGTYTLSYNVSDAAGNAAATVTRAVYVQDTQPPVLALLGDPVMSVQAGTAFADPGAQATDDYYGDISSLIVVTGTVDTSQAGEYTLRYNVKDPSDNAAAEATRTVTVTARSGSGGSGNTGNSGTSGGEPASIRQVSVKINGVVKRVGASYETSGGQRITRIFPTAEQLSEAWTTKPNSIRIEAQDIGDSVKMDLPAASLLHALEVRPDALLEWSVNGNGLRIPIHVLQGVPKEATVTFGIAAAAGSVGDAGNGAIATAGGEPLLPHPVVFSLQANDGSSIDWGRTYATLTAALPEPANPDQSAAVRIDANGRMRFAPAVFSNDGSPLATIRSPYSGAYSIIRSDHSFADLNGHWAQKDIVLMKNKLLVEGRTQDRFVPDDLISRAEFAAMLVRALGLDDEPDGSTPFRDVAPGAWYAGAVRAAHRDQLIDGFEDGTFRPEAPITREQMAVMIVRAMEYAGYAPDANGATTRTFADEADIAPWADDAVGRLTGASIILGVTETKLGPREYASRAQGAVQLKRMLKAMQFINP
ncbi:MULTISPECIES: immunoglobulin-like domain-containing protein [unclassified Cohnella]|uniref:RCC1 domain-containing protein n=1 Tax=unclassified Cohnella TaxID=2636738 RepID=UPI001E360104|nr:MULTISPECIES: immunoglobulin-like domain-containing protein [unclassified Cohnella]